jgi:hypothetical protein
MTNKQWGFGFLLPHAYFSEPIEHAHFALVPPSDERLCEMIRTSPAVERLCTAFTDQFGQQVEPSALLIRPDAPAKIEYYEAACFRNPVAISSLVDAWTFFINGGRAGYPLWSDYFDFYSFTVTRDGDLSAESVAITELDLPGEFAGQKAPHLPRNNRVSFGVDRRMLDNCLRFWDRRFVKKRVERKTRRLFRSLEIAYLAGRVPAVGSRETSIHDYGAVIALWISAIEILSHKKDKTKPKKKAAANLLTVLELLSKIEWGDSDLCTKPYWVEYHGTRYSLNVIQKLYLELYRARNAFLHGNAVKPSHLYPCGNKSAHTLMHCAPLIYRAAVLAFTDGEHKMPKGDVAAQVNAYMSYERPQRKYEEAVLSCRP